VTAYARFVQQQKDDFLNQFVADPSYLWVRIPNLDRFQYRCCERRWEPLPGLDKVDAVVWDGEGRPELWVRPIEKRGCTNNSDKTLYLRAWAGFVRHHGKTLVETKFANSSHAIDHLSPETAAFRQGYSHVRVALVNAISNRRVGATVEKVLARFAAKAGGYQADWTTLAKVLGMNGSWRITRPAGDVAAELLTLARANGMPFDDCSYLGDLTEWIDYRRRNQGAW